MDIERIITDIEVMALEFGAQKDTDFKYRKNINFAKRDNAHYFGFVRPEEGDNGAYHDFSLVFFPSNPEELDENGKCKVWLICIGVGSLGFKNDYDLASQQGLRRLFAPLIDENGYIRSDFQNIDTPLPYSVLKNQNLAHFHKNKVFDRYKNFISACEIIEDPQSEIGQKTIASFLAAYADIRGWATTKKEKEKVAQALYINNRNQSEDDIVKISSLLKERFYVVLQGAPGIGKTRAAKEVSKQMEAKTFFTQFHAETSYSDFIYGIRPDTSEKNKLVYQGERGIFAKALSYAEEHKNEKVVLIIDEINRANLSNVLGPIFYLFEQKMESSDYKIEIAPELNISQLPKNFFVIASMNTADRSLAVVDFALRRRFAWYTMKPVTINGKADTLDGNKSINQLGNEKVEKVKVNKIDGQSYFFIDDFNKIANLFEKYATSDELALQPGQGYFIASSFEEMTNRILYEVYPLIKEYLQEGLLRIAQEEFNSYFLTRINQSLFE